MKLIVALRNFSKAHKKQFKEERNEKAYEGWNFNSGNYLFTTDTK